MIKWGIIGLGNISNKFVNAIKEVDNSKIVAVSSLTKKKNSELIKNLNIEENLFFSNYDELLNCKDIDAVYIATLNNTHLDLAIKSIKAKKNILCEKPITLNFNEAEKIKKELVNSDITFSEAFAYRSHPQTKELCKIIDEKEIGDIHSLESSFGYNTKRINPNSRIFNKKLGGGAILDVGCYPTSLSLLIARIIKKDIDLNQFKLSNIKGNICETGVDDIAHADLTFDNKIVMKLNTSIRKHMINNCIIKGTKGKIVISSPWNPEKRSFFEIYTDQRYYKKFVNSDYSVYASQIDMFAKKIQNKNLKDTMMEIDESLVNMRILDEWSKGLSK